MPKFNTVYSKLVLSMRFVLVVCFVIYLVNEGNIAKNSVLKNEYENYKNRLESTQTLIDVYINEKTNVINELQKDIAKNLEDENLISTKLALGKDLGGFSLTYLGVEDTGRMIRSNFNNQSPSDGYEARTRDWYSKT